MTEARPCRDLRKENSWQRTPTPPTPPLPPRASLECTQKDWVSKRSDRWAGPDPAGPGKELRVLKFKFLDCSKMGEEGGMA